MGKKMQGKEIIPRSIGKVRKGAYYISDCPDYEPRINIPKKVSIKDPFTGWNCLNCKNLKVSGKEWKIQTGTKLAPSKRGSNL